jgi:hypothetical protein
MDSLRNVSFARRIEVADAAGDDMVFRSLHASEISWRTDSPGAARPGQQLKAKVECQPNVQSNEPGRGIIPISTHRPRAVGPERINNREIMCAELLLADTLKSV